jgi:hypothetical protein
MALKTTCLLLAALLIAGAGASQPAPDLVTMRPPELKKLDPLVGAWEGVATFYATPSSPKSTSPLKAAFRWILRTYHLEGTLNYTQQGKPLEARILLTYDWNRKLYQAYWVDDFSSLPVLYSGSLRDGTLALTATVQQQPRPFKQRLQLKMLPGDDWQMTISSDFSGDMADNYTLRAHRKK